MKMYKAIKTDAWTLIPEIVDVDFKIRTYESLSGHWIHVIKGGITGFESAEVERLIEKYPKRGVFGSWIACAGTLRKYHHLAIPMSEVIKFLENNNLVDIERQYGYIKKISWKDNSEFTTKDEEEK